jgi:ferritin-like metal-binding protein YciE
MAKHDTVRDELIAHLHEAYSMEGHLAQVLQEQLKNLGQYPQFQQRIQQHLDETKEHQDRMAQCLERMGKLPMQTRTPLSGLMNRLEGVEAGQFHDLVQVGRDDYSAEHFEIATYTGLIALAHLFGDNETVRACEANLREDIVMALWLERHQPEAMLRSLQARGINVPDGAFAQEVGLAEERLRLFQQEAERVTRIGNVPTTGPGLATNVASDADISTQP